MNYYNETDPFAVRWLKVSLTASLIKCNERHNAIT